MLRALSLHLPWWNIELARRRLLRRAVSGSRADGVPHGPVPVAILLVATVSQRRVVASCCARATREGVTPGMTLAHARALLPASGVHVEDHDPARDHASLVRLAMWAHRFSPVVAPDPPDGLLIDITGCARAFKGEGRLLRRVIAGVQWLGFTARGAIGPTFGSAWAMARFADRIETRHGVIIDSAQAREAMAPLPLEALRVARETVDALSELGAETIGQVMALPRSSLPARFGTDLLHRLDQALGEAMERIEPVRPVPYPSVERLFEGATTRTDAIEACVRQLIDELAELLAERESGVRSLLLELGRVDSVPIEIRIPLSRPCRDAKHLWTLIRSPLERANLGFGVERVTLTATRVGRVRHAQAERWRDGGVSAGSAARAEAAALVDLLSNRLGADRVTRVEAHPTHLPERAALHRPAMHADDAGVSNHHVAEGAGSTLWSPPGRPSLLFEKPEPADAIAMVPDSPPSCLRWRGRELAIAAGHGPERIAPEWWLERGGPTRGAQGACDGAARDYYRVRDESGIWLWVYREVETARWFVHGMWA